MAFVSFTQNLERHVECPRQEVAGNSVRDVLDAVFERNERARGYVLDEQGAVRKHINTFIGGTPIRDRSRLSDEVFVFQALSGG